MGVQKVYMDPNEKCLTQQAPAEETDINIIVEKAKRGAVPPTNGREGIYGDFRNLPDLRSAMLIVKEAEEGFMSLDARVRQRFDNDPRVMLDFLKDPANRPEAIALGLVNAPPPAPPVKEDVGGGSKKSKPKAEDD